MADMRILLISGSTRHGSGNTAALRTVQAAAPDGIIAEMYQGLATLPAFSFRAGRWRSLDGWTGQ
jgi:chromate reductase, NAD(P)H dehydrogenase (quinone)